MRVLVKHFMDSKPKVEELSSIVEGAMYVNSERGELEDIKNNLEKTQEVLAKLIDCLCEHGVLRLEHAVEIINSYKYTSIERVP